MGKAEAHVEDYLVKRIKAIGGLTRKAAWIARKGCPDRRVMLPLSHRLHIARLCKMYHSLDGVNPWVECKALDGELDVIQIREHARMVALGELVLVVHTRELVDHYFPLVLP